MNQAPRHITAAAVIDGEGRHFAPGALLIEDRHIVACGPVEQITATNELTQFVELPNCVLIPALVNAHAHLDLSHIGPLAYDGDFASWLDRILAERAAIDREGIAASVRLGAQLARTGGTGLIGDIAGGWQTEPLHALRESDLQGVSFLEVFGIGQRQDGAIAAMRDAVRDLVQEANGVRLGISPHAPYTCGQKLYQAAAQLGLPVSTHVAESLEELQFCDRGDGPFADLLKKLKVWDESIVGLNRHPVTILEDSLAAAPTVAAHLNYVTDEAIEHLARTGTTVAYCPRSSAYFGHPHAEQPPHRYRDMLTAGVNVALGTDSLVCLDTPDRISVLDEMRFLYQRDGTDPQVLLQMATVNGARGLGYDPSLVSFGVGPTLGVLAVGGETLAQALSHGAPPQWVCDP